jgi:hypothetical protein
MNDKLVALLAFLVLTSANPEIPAKFLNPSSKQVDYINVYVNQVYVHPCPFIRSTLVSLVMAVIHQTDLVE